MFVPRQGSIQVTAKHFHKGGVGLQLLTIREVNRVVGKVASGRHVKSIGFLRSNENVET